MLNNLNGLTNSKELFGWPVTANNASELKLESIIFLDHFPVSKRKVAIKLAPVLAFALAEVGNIVAVTALIVVFCLFDQVAGSV